MDADLHIHTSVSDGCLTPAEAVRVAQSINLKAIAITDHDTMDGVEEALEEGKKLNIEVIPGVELSTDYGRKEVHLLGYYVNSSHKNFHTLLERLKESRHKRVTNIVKKLNGLGCKVDVREVMKLAGENGAVGRPHIARVLTEKGYVKDVQDAFDKFIGINAPAYVERYKLIPHDVIKMVIKAGGVPVLAHPGLIKDDDLIMQLIKEGLKGIEVYHPEHSYEDERKYQTLAFSHKLLITGGSDCHGIDRMTGSEMGSVTIPMYHVERLKEVAKQIKEKDMKKGI
ncbi:MAG: PHP domain-containing protein [Candidatus Syntrophonatronum acetioxidans]|uniref:PHP domain-containing protein n=1 Tax=Candidatus Syntrophonatronum acetioxidans TaxID=1795816 RepID=A0A424YDB7_9FIRM|nr:MAG: PHP domain-containing protein [Candidatus Syntrophonatronum acetioxidans]